MFEQELYQAYISWQEEHEYSTTIEQCNREGCNIYKEKDLWYPKYAFSCNGR